jgi:hypothetical protein
VGDSESEADVTYSRRVHDLERVGDRRSAGAGDHAAAVYLGGQLRSGGIRAEKEPFRGSSSYGARFLVHTLVAAAGGAVLARWPLAGAALAAVALASLVAEQMTRGVWLSRVVSRSRSYNVVARLPAAAAPTRRVVVCAHYDAQRRGWICGLQQLLLAPMAHLPVPLMQPMLLLECLMLAQVVAGVLAAAVPGAAPPGPALALLLACYGVFAVLYGEWAVGRGVPGASDNASGAAAAVEIAEAWRARPPAESVELVLVLTGCEETGLMGAAAWAHALRRGSDGVPTVVLNIDSVGFGPPRFLGTEVPAAGVPLKVPDWLRALCERVARDQALAGAGPHALPGPTDALAFLARGVPAVSVVGFRDGPALPHYHTMRDTAANMDFAAARAGRAFAAEVVRALALEAIPALDKPAGRADSSSVARGMETLRSP